MDYQAIFKRYEIKYLLDQGQKERLLTEMQPHMALDQYGQTTIRNVYFDTENFLLIRRSLEKPVYKEKLRLRSYRQAAPEEPVFAEVKKKYKGIVYKRRLALPQEMAMDWLCRGKMPGQQGQIYREIEYLRKFYGSLRPAMFLSYERRAFTGLQETDFRVTLDDRILGRREDISLTRPPGGIDLLPPGKVLLELKTSGGLPLWMTAFLSREGLRKISFSKYAEAYKRLVLPNFKGECVYAGNMVSRNI